MPAKPRASRKTTPAKTEKSASPAMGDDAEPGRFTAGAGPLAEDMKANFEAVATQAQAIRLQKLGADGRPVDEPVFMDGTSASINLESMELPEDAELAAAMNTLQRDGVSVEFEVTDPATVEAIRQLVRIPIPTAVINQWWPAFVRPPDEDHAWNLCKVFLTPQGLYVYRTPPSVPETFASGAMPAWYSTVDFEKTRKPVSGYAARNAGIPIVTAAGTVNVQPTGGCGCAHRGLKRWRPTWSRNVIRWEDGVRLATGSTAGR